MVTKVQAKRLDKMAENLTTDQRVIAYLKAVKGGDESVLEHLTKTTPLRSYTCKDMGVSNSIRAAMAIGMGLDIDWYHAMSEKWRGRYHFMQRWLEDEKADRDKIYFQEVMGAQARLLALVRAAEIVSERMGLEIATMFAFSTAIELKEWSNCLEQIKEASPDLRENNEKIATGLADQLLELWNQVGGRDLAAEQTRH